MRKAIVSLVVLAVALAIGVVPAGAITNGQPDGNEHPYVGELLFYVPDEVDPRFDDPGAWFTCSGTLVSPTVVLTAGHCTFAVGLDGEPTTAGGGNGGNDIWVNFDEEPNFDGFPPSADYIPDRNQQRYEDRVDWLSTQPEWHRGTAQSHPNFNPNAFFLFDAGVVVLDDPVSMNAYGQLPKQGRLDAFLKNGKNDALFTPVGYGLTRSGPPSAGRDAGGDVRLKGTVKLVNLKGTFGVPDGTSAVFSNNNGKPHQGGTCFGDSGGPIFIQGTREIVAVTSFGTNLNCAGTGGAYRIDQADDLAFLAKFGVVPPS
jgi:hypothetical protein